jgi:hypothetical protein
LAYWLCSALSFRARAVQLQHQGVVLDQSGAAVPGASVVLTNVDTGIAQRAQSAIQNYRFNSLEPGNYLVESLPRI